MFHPYHIFWKGDVVMATKEELFKEEYGDVPLESMPVDPDNPTFDSLLGALKAVYSGEMELSVLEKYHRELSRQLEVSRKNITGINIPEEFKEIATPQMEMSIGALDIVQMTMDLLGAYIDDPTKEKMADCLVSLLNSQSVMRQLNQILDDNIKKMIENNDEE